VIASVRAAAAAAVIGALWLASTTAHAQALREEIEGIVKEYIATHPDEVGQIAKDYLLKHPEVVQEILSGLLRSRGNRTSSAPGGPAQAVPDKTAAVKANAAALFGSVHQVTLGNAQGDVTLVEFFDYNCGFCKRALGDLVGLIKADPQIKVVLKEFPILGPGSVEAARVAVAVRMQDPGGQKYLEFHRKLLGGQGHADKARALAAAREAGLDVAQIEKDLTSEEVNKSLAESAALARDLGLTGTPSYVIGDKVAIGAIGLAALTDRVKAARSQAAN
jgi:protein-disulfide isomerase